MTGTIKVPPTATSQDLMAAAVQAHRAGDTAGAEKAYRTFIELFGAAPEVLNNLAGLRYLAGDWDEAATLYEQIISSGPEHPAVYSNLARARTHQGQWTNAVQAFEKALALEPTDADVWNDLGNARVSARDFAGGALAYQQAVTHRPEFARAHNNLGNTLRALGTMDPALTAYHAACDLTPDSHPDAGELHTNRAHALLLVGQWTDGFQAYEWRWRKPGVPAAFDPGSPHWNGESLRGKRLLLVAEQGFGDCLLGLRFAQSLADQSAWVGFVGPQSLVRLAARVRGISAAFSFNDALPAHDQHCSIMSLPRLLRAEPGHIPGDVPYVDITSTAPRKPGQLRVGLTWAGNATHVDDASRSFGFKALRVVLEVTDIDFVSLQVGEAAAQALGDTRTSNGVADVKDFFDTARVIADLDAVVAADSVVAHLSGAMGIPTFVPLPVVPDWRYGLHGDTSPFFPSMRLYRQRVRGDWTKPMADIAEDVTNLKDQHR